MRITGIEVANYRALRDVRINLSRFSCLIGKNNSGKSSILQAMALLHSGLAVKESDYYDKKLPIRIALNFEDVTKSDLEHVQDEQHRSRFTAMLIDGAVTLVRIYEAGGGRGTLKYVKQIPKQSRYRESSVQQMMGSLSGEELRSAVIRSFPELGTVLKPKPTKASIKDEVERLRSQLTAEDLVASDEPLPTGLDKSIAPLLPEVVYIPAVKDVSDEIKTSGSATFGKLLAILFDEIKEEFGAIDSQFKELQAKLSRIYKNGEEVDERLSQVRVIESTVEKYVQQHFPDVKMQIRVPAPELRAVLDGAELTADDGTNGPVTAKGDGLKRAIAFAILQAYAELRTSGLDAGSEGPPVSSRSSRYLLLFEEPELYLHPSAQRQLFEALAVFSREHAVMVTTHSPAFFDSKNTGTFVKVYKKPGESDLPPSTHAHVIDLSDLSAKDQLQLIGFENNHAALFADQIVLIEGDSDFLIFPHLAALCHKSWSVTAAGVLFVRVSGKGSFQRYKSFFARFDVPTHIICDLDAIVNGFDKLLPDDDSIEARRLLNERLAIVEAASNTTASGASIKDIRKGGETRGLWEKAQGAHLSWQTDSSKWPNVETAMSALFDRLVAPVRYQLLQNSEDAELLRLKKNLLACLARQGVYPLSRGCLEDYYPESVAGSDKIEKAFNYIENLTSLAAINDVSQRNGELTPSEEFAAMFQAICSSAAKMEAVTPDAKDG